jgi:hypothetical protein
VALTQPQKWAIGGVVAVGALVIGYKLLHKRPTQRLFLPSGHPHGEPAGLKRHRHKDGHEHERGEYGHKREHRRRHLQG